MHFGELQLAMASYNLLLASHGWHSSLWLGQRLAAAAARHGSSGEEGV
jgi:hypothetical protein